jgi:DNA mismatch repair ATPase MutS
MAGKSTFLRSLGLNIILASVGLPVCAKALTLSPFQLLSSMKPQDSINEDRSYFQAEIIRLRSILDHIAQRGPSFVLFDEILRGTNSEDKRNGSVQFLQKLKDYDLVGVIATHDVEISEIKNEHGFFANFFFESRHVEGQLSFDYTLREGVCRTPNASELLKQFGII